MMPFSVVDPRGIRIRLTPGRLAHILELHPEVERCLSEVRRAVTDPDVIQRSRRRGDTHLYYWLRPADASRYSSLYVVVVIGLSVGGKAGRVWTAYLSRRLGKGEVLWRRPSPRSSR